MMVGICSEGLVGEELEKPSERIWTSAAGTSITGTLGGVKAQTVLIHTNEGEKLSVPIRSLSPADRSYAMDAHLQKSSVVIATSQRRLREDKTRRVFPKALGWTVPEFARLSGYEIDLLTFFPRESLRDIENVDLIHKSLMNEKYDEFERYFLLDPSALPYQDEDAHRRFERLMSLHENSAKSSGVTLLLVYPKLPWQDVVYRTRKRGGRKGSRSTLSINGMTVYTSDQGEEARTVEWTRTPEECEKIFDDLLRRSVDKWIVVPMDEALCSAPELAVVPTLYTESTIENSIETMERLIWYFSMTLDDYLYDSALFSFLTYQQAPLRQWKHSQIASDKKKSEKRSSPLPSFSDADLNKASEAVFFSINKP
ncbi:MAG: hypothetical protein ACSHYB_06780 [Roseibacillus sp.]